MFIYQEVMREVSQRDNNTETSWTVPERLHCSRAVVCAAAAEPEPTSLCLQLSLKPHTTLYCTDVWTGKRLSAIRAQQSAEVHRKHNSIV